MAGQWARGLLTLADGWPVGRDRREDGAKMARPGAGQWDTGPGAGQWGMELARCGSSRAGGHGDCSPTGAAWRTKKSTKSGMWEVVPGDVGGCERYNLPHLNRPVEPAYKACGRCGRCGR